MSENVKISIIMPFYNAEEYIKKAIESVINQSFKNFELICINDGSVDNSLAVVENYAQNDSRIKIINKKNEGQGIARNLAIKQAIGTYILYLDSDDWLVNDALELMYKKISSDNSDIVFFDFYNMHAKTGEININKFTDVYFGYTSGGKTFSPLEAKDVLFQTNALPFKIYNKKFLLDNDVVYSNHRFLEDSVFYVKAMSCIKEPLCYHLRHDKSVSHSVFKNFDTIFDIFLACEKIVLNSKFPDEFMYSFLKNRMTQIQHYFNYKRLWLKKRKCYKIMQKMAKYMLENYNQVMQINIFLYERLELISKFNLEGYLLYLRLYCRLVKTYFALTITFK